MKGQVTVFIIIGILVLIAFSFAIYIGSKISDKEEHPVKEQIRTGSIQGSIETCLSLATTQSLRLLGKQGGILFEAQGGITQPSSEHVAYSDTSGTYTAQYLITPPEGNVGTLFFSEIPDYPFEGFPFVPGDNPGEIKTLFTGYYGVSKLPPLYKTSAETGNNVQGSIQETLEKSIAEQTKSCADFSSYKDQGYEITSNEPKVSLIFAVQQEQFVGEQYLTVQLDWEVDVKAPGGEVTSFETIANREPVRLATLYYTIKEIIDSDVTDISYAPRAPDGFAVSNEEKQDYSILTLTDTRSVLEGRALEFSILRKNRKPALWEIEEINQMFHITPSGNGAELILENGELRIRDPCPQGNATNPYVAALNASDPDENQIEYEVTVPYTTGNQLPQEAIGQDFEITITAKDQLNEEDYQKIKLEVALCPVQ